MLAYILSKRNLETKEILEFEEYVFKEDIDYLDKSSITFVKQPNIEDGDFILCKDENKIVFLGICEKVKSESNENDYSITILQKENLFNRFIFAEYEELIANTGIEDFIAKAITDNFISSKDSLLDKSWLKVTALTHTKIAAKVDTEQGVYNLKTYMGNAKQHYHIFTEFKFKNSSLEVTIFKKDDITQLVDIEVSDVYNYKENYDISVLAKLNVKWKKTEESKEGVYKVFFLLSDRTISEDITNAKRIEGSIRSISITAEKEEEMRQRVVNEFSSNRYNHKVTFNLIRNSQLYPEADFFVGRSCVVKTKSGVKQSMITKRELRNTSALLAITLGNLKVSLTEKIRRY